MNAAERSLLLLVTLFFNLAILALMMRFLLQWVKADFYNPVSQTVVKLTDPLLRPLRRIIPGYGGAHVAALTALLLAEILGIVVLGLIYEVGVPHPLQLLLWALLGLISFFLSFYFFAILAMIVLSWLAPGAHNPAVYLLYQLTEPVMGPFRKLIPPLGGLDLSPIFVFVAIQIAQYFLADAATGVGLPPQLVIGF